MREIWPAGPPKFTKPSQIQNRDASRKLGAGGPSSLWGFSDRDPSGGRDIATEGTLAACS
jgi:hypothetical protein